MKRKVRKMSTINIRVVKYHRRRVIFNGIKRKFSRYISIEKFKNNDEKLKTPFKINVRVI